MKKQILYFALLTLIGSRATAQNIEWAKGWGGTRNDSYYIKSLLVDQTNNVYATGIFEGTVDFDPGPGITNLTAVGSEDAFISKLDNSGNLDWVMQLGGLDFVRVATVAADPLGN